MFAGWLCAYSSCNASTLIFWLAICICFYSTLINWIMLWMRQWLIFPCIYYAHVMEYWWCRENLPIQIWATGTVRRSCFDPLILWKALLLHCSGECGNKGPGEHSVVLKALDLRMNYIYCVHLSTLLRGKHSTYLLLLIVINPLLGSSYCSQLHLKYTL